MGHAILERVLLFGTRSADYLLTGFYVVYRFNLWDRFRYGVYWWMDAMVAVWLLFALMLFVAEPLILHRWLLARVAGSHALLLFQ